MFVLLHSATLDLPDGDLPKRLVVLPWGANDTVSAGKVTVNSVTLAELPRHQERMNFDRVALDFNHNTVEGSPWYKGEPAKVAAFAVPQVIEGVGLVFEDLEWTPEGEEHVRGKHYIDLSAAVKTNERGEVIFCHSAGVCRQGQIKDLHILATDPFKTETQQTMDAEKLKALLLLLLGLDEEATEEEIEAAVKARAESSDEDSSEEIEALSTRIDALEKLLKDADDGGDTAVLAAKFESRIESLEKRNEQMAREAIREKALREGKLIPLSADSLTLAQFETLVGELPAGQVPLDQRTPEGVKTLSSSGLTTHNSAEAQVRKNLGISQEVWEKHNS